MMVNSAGVPVSISPAGRGSRTDTGSPALRRSERLPAPFPSSAWRSSSTCLPATAEIILPLTRAHQAKILAGKGGNKVNPSQTATTYPKEVNWPRHTAYLRTARKEKQCFVCKQPIPAGSRFYSIVLWGAGLAGKKFPSYTCLSCLEAYINATDR